MNVLGQTLSPALQRLGDVSVRLSVELGRTDMALKDVLALAEGSVVSLDRMADELLDITANGQVIAHGEVIAQDGRFALRIVSLAGGENAGGSPPKAETRNAPNGAANTDPSAAEDVAHAAPPQEADAQRAAQPDLVSEVDDSADTHPAESSESSKGDASDASDGL
jgi:flagellar motor switch protein FliN/FliY